jgi:hypothetical protein
MKFTTFIVCFLIAMFTAPAMAGVFIEPYAGYGIGNWEQGASGQDLKGLIYGARVGYVVDGIGGGIEYMAGTLKDEGSPALSFKGTNTGVWAGYNFPFLVRIFATYFFDSQSEHRSASFEGTGTKFGIGFTGLDPVSINLETMTTDWDTNNSSIVTKSKTTLLTVSLPFDFGA